VRAGGGALRLPRDNLTIILCSDDRSGVRRNMQENMCSIKHKTKREKESEKKVRKKC